MMLEFSQLIPLLLFVTVLYISMIILLFLQRYIKINARNKVLQFTQEEIKEKKKTITKLFQNYKESNYKELSNIYEILDLYNELAVGINEGLYDELYVKMVLGHSMINIYKKYYDEVISLQLDFEDDTLFMPLELLLKKWGSNDGPSYRFNYRRRYM